jgi:hypothetical protein
MPAFTTVTYTPIDLKTRESYGSFELPAWPTPNEHLVIVPAIEYPSGQVAEGYELLHLPTGLLMTLTPTPRARPLARVRRLAELVADLDWSSADRVALVMANNEAYQAAVRSLTAIVPSPEEQSTAREDGGGAARQALPFVRQTLDRLQRSWDRTIGTEDSVKFELDDGTINPQWLSEILIQVDTYSIAYLLGCLHRLDPYTADQVAAHLADALEAGDAMGEWAYQWRRELDAGLPMSLYGVTVPEPLFGSHYGEHVDVVFDGPPGPEAGRFVEVENDQGRSIRLGEWVERPDGYWALRIPATALEA